MLDIIMVGEAIACPAATTEPCVKLSLHTAPLLIGSCHEYLFVVSVFLLWQTCEHEGAASCYITQVATLVRQGHRNRVFSNVETRD